MILTNQKNNSDVQVVKDINEEPEGYTKLQKVVRGLVTSCSSRSSECVTNSVDTYLQGLDVVKQY